MKISHLKVYKEIKDYSIKKVLPLAVAGMLMLVGLTGCKSKDHEQGENAIENQQVYTKVYNVGEHIVSIPLDFDPTKQVCQYKTYKGYKCVGITTTAYGQTMNCFGGGCLLFVNEYPVELKYTIDKYGKEVYAITNKNDLTIDDHFGKPIGYEEAEVVEDEESRVFNPGEHLISVPVYSSGLRNQIVKLVMEYQSYEGYEPIGMACASNGKIDEYFAGGCILYANIKPVRCQKIIDKNGEIYYNQFGTVVEDTKSLD